MSVKCILQGQKDESNIFAITATLGSDGETITTDKTPAEAAAAVKDDKLVIMYLDGEPIIGPDNAGDNDISFNGAFGDFIVNISGINNTWDPLEYKRLDNLPFPQGSDDLYIFTNLNGEKSGEYWATASELRNGLQLYTRSEI